MGIEFQKYNTLMHETGYPHTFRPVVINFYASSQTVYISDFRFSALISSRTADPEVSSKPVPEV